MLSIQTGILTGHFLSQVSETNAARLKNPERIRILLYIRMGVIRTVLFPVLRALHIMLVLLSPADYLRNHIALRTVCRFRWLLYILRMRHGVSAGGVLFCPALFAFCLLSRRRRRPVVRCLPGTRRVGSIVRMPGGCLRFHLLRIRFFRLHHVHGSLLRLVFSRFCRRCRFRGPIRLIQPPACAQAAGNRLRQRRHQLVGRMHRPEQAGLLPFLCLRLHPEAGFHILCVQSICVGLCQHGNHRTDTALPVQFIRKAARFFLLRCAHDNQGRPGLMASARLLNQPARPPGCLKKIRFLFKRGIRQQVFRLFPAARSRAVFNPADIEIVPHVLGEPALRLNGPGQNGIQRIPLPAFPLFSPVQKQNQTQIDLLKGIFHRRHSDFLLSNSIMRGPCRKPLQAAVSRSSAVIPGHPAALKSKSLKRKVP